MNELRRDSVSGRWSIIIHDEVRTEQLLVNLRKREGHGSAYDSSCPFCEGNEGQTPPEIFAMRSSGGANGRGWQLRVIPDKFPVLRVEGELNNRAHGMYDVLNGIGAHEIVIECPQHNQRLIDLAEPNLSDVFSVYQSRMQDLKNDKRFRYVLAYKTYGEASGPAVHHSYSYIIATPITPPRVKEELMNAAQHFARKERCLFCDILRQEQAEDARVVGQTQHFLAFLPFASRAPMEVWIMPKEHETFFETNEHVAELAALFRRTMYGISDLLQDPNYVMLIHSGPNTSYGQRRGYWKTLTQDFHWHLEIIPRLRGYTSFELVSGLRVNFLPPERGAAILREHIESTSPDSAPTMH